MEAPAAKGAPSRPSGKPRRPKRGAPADTRERLVAAAAAVFNRDGYHGTDSNRLARAAGYAPATFYKHFADKRAILLAAYEAWVTSEWRSIAAVLRGSPSAADRAERIVTFVLGHHRRWKGLRASLRALIATDPVVRRFHRAQRRRQLEILAGMRRSARTIDARRRRHPALHARAHARRGRRGRDGRARPRSRAGRRAAARAGTHLARTLGRLRAYAEAFGTPTPRPGSRRARGNVSRVGPAPPARAPIDARRRPAVLEGGPGFRSPFGERTRCNVPGACVTIRPRGARASSAASTCRRASRRASPSGMTRRSASAVS